MVKMTVSVVTPDQLIFQDEALCVRARGWDGYFTILPNHAPMVFALAAGEIAIEGINQKQAYVAIESGIVEVADNQVNILSQVAVMAEESDVATAKMEAQLGERQKKNIKDREQAIKSEMELYRLLRQANESG